jgi:hypothetical protein
MADHSQKAFVDPVKTWDEVAVKASRNVRMFCAVLKDRGCWIAVVNPHQPNACKQKPFLF